MIAITTQQFINTIDLIGTLPTEYPPTPRIVEQRIEQLQGVFALLNLCDLLNDYVGEYLKTKLRILVDLKSKISPKLEDLVFGNEKGTNRLMADLGLSTYEIGRSLGRSEGLVEGEKMALEGFNKRYSGAC